MSDIILSSKYIVLCQDYIFGRRELKIVMWDIGVSGVSFLLNQKFEKQFNLISSLQYLLIWIFIRSTIDHRI